MEKKQSAVGNILDKMRQATTQRNRNTIEGSEDNKKGKRVFFRLPLENNEKSVEEEVEVPYEIEGEVKSICRKVALLREIGHSEKSIVKWMMSFVTHLSPCIQQAFIRVTPNRKSLVDGFLYERETNVPTIVSKFEKFVKKANETELAYIINEVRELRRYIENITIKKTEARLQDITNYTTQNIRTEEKVEMPAYPSTEIIHFMKDLRMMEDRHGKLLYVSELNRCKFNKLQESEQRITEGFRAHNHNV